MKYTAVEWLESQLKDNLGKIVINQQWQLFEQLLDMAKQIEKQDIVDAHKSATIDAGFECSAEEWAEQYYNETFKNTEI
jgi:adenylate kinase